MIKQILREAEKQLDEQDIPASYARYVMNELFLKQNRNLYLEMDEALDETTHQTFNEILEKLLKQMPLAYAMGVQYFYGYPIEVNEHVLIPRFETEELVLKVLMEADNRFSEAITVFDIATGSGAIACTIKKELPQAEVYASDISASALKQAQHNAKQLYAEISFFEGNMADPFLEREMKADIIVCNPPYIPEDETVEVSVEAYEPHLALFGGKDGLYFYHELLKHADRLLNRPGLLAFEIGYNQKTALSRLVEQYLPDAQYEVHQDMQGKDRMLMIHLSEFSKQDQ